MIIFPSYTFFILYHGCPKTIFITLMVIKLSNKKSLSTILRKDKINLWKFKTFKHYATIVY